MNAHARISPQMAASSRSEPRPAVPVSRVGNAAYALEKAAMGMLWASTPISKRVAQEIYDAAVEDMRALLEVM